MQRPNGGFTMVEVAASAFVLAVTSVGLAAALAQGGTLVDDAREEYAARSAMSEALADMAITPWSEVADRWDGEGFDVPALRAAPGDPDELPGEIEFDYGPAGETEFYSVRLTVRWHGERGVRVIESLHFLANVRGDAGAPAPLE